jgi:hypothetical protein
VKLAALGALMGAAALAQPAPNRCASNAEYRRFDFWVGEWDVEVGGQKVARSRIDKSADGCIIVENWMPFGGGEGKSWNFFNASSGQWEQIWVTSTGEVLKVAGGWKDGAMREQGASASAMHRHSFTPLPGDRVRQFCEESTDGGKTWHVVFDGLYVRR